MVRLATKEDLTRVNEMRKMVNDMHVAGRPDIFRAGFGEELANHIYVMWENENRDILVVERDGAICGYACVLYVDRPETPYSHRRKFYHIDEFGVDERFRRQKVATELFDYMRTDAKEKGFARIELDMWEFNEEALKFYEAVGFQTYRRYMEFTVD